MYTDEKLKIMQKDFTLFLDQKLKKLDEFPPLNSFIKQHGLIKTSSEKDYESLEPWIQWPSFYYSAKLKDHKIFHLGDRPKLSLKSIYNKLSLNKKNFLE